LNIPFDEADAIGSSFEIHPLGAAPDLEHHCPELTFSQIAPHHVFCHLSMNSKPKRLIQKKLLTFKISSPNMLS
jgi:hypothetical protein